MERLGFGSASSSESTVKPRVGFMSFSLVAFSSLWRRGREAGM
jgi:hypothetical protein